MSELPTRLYPNVLLVAGTGRNSGKTSFVCHICRQWNDPIPLVCIKISNHIHMQPGTLCLYASSAFNIYEETLGNTDKDKDTARMLQAGASKVLFIEADKEFVYQAFQKALDVIPEEAAIICESGSLRRYLKPSLFVMLHTAGSEPKESSKDLLSIADIVFENAPGNLSLPEKPVVFSKRSWKLNIYVPG